MSSRSFGEWYQSQKNEPSLRPATTEPRNWFSSLIKGRETTPNDVESVGLLSHVRNAGSRVTEFGDVVKETLVFLGLACVFFLIAFFIGLPTLMLRPAKFIISFTMGSIMTMAGLARMQGVSNFLQSVFQSDRIVKTILYFVSLLLSIFFAVVKRSYVGTVASSVFQIIMLLLFVLESFPAGSKVTSVLFMMIRKSMSFVQSLIKRFIK